MWSCSHKINSSLLLDWSFLYCSKHSASPNFSKHFIRHISTVPLPLMTINTLLACLASKGFKMTHKPHLAYTVIKYCPASLKFIVHLLKNPCIKRIIQPCQGKHLNLITFRNQAFWWAHFVYVYREKGPLRLIWPAPRSSLCSIHTLSGLFCSDVSQA